MEQELKEFIEETKLKIPSHFGRITAPTIKNGDNSESNPLYYQKNVFGFKKTLEDRIDKTSNVSSILNNYVSSLTNLFQDIVLIFVHIHNNNSRDVDTSLKNYFNSLNEIELYNKDILNQQLIVDNDEFTTGKWVYQKSFFTPTFSGDITWLIRGYNESNSDPITFYLDDFVLAEVQLRP